MLKTTKTWLAVLLATSIPVDARSPSSRPPESEVEDHIRTSAIVGYSWVDQPVDRVLLLKNDGVTCAIIFRSFHEEDDARKVTSFDTGDASRYASFESVEIGGRRSTTVKRGQFSDRGMRGLGRLAFHVGNQYVRCGRARYGWQFPTAIFLPRDGTTAALAPTAWARFEDIRLDEPALVWHSLDPSFRQPIEIIPVENLPR